MLLSSKETNDAYAQSIYSCHSIRRTCEVQGCPPYALEVRRTLERSSLYVPH